MDHIRLFAPDSQDDLVYTGSAIVLTRRKKETVFPLAQIASFDVVESSNGRRPGVVTIKTSGASDVYLKATSFLSVGFGNETVFYFDPVCNEKAQRIRDLIASGGSNNATETVRETASAADEIRKFKALLDDGIISQDEFDAKKKQLLGL